MWEAKAEYADGTSVCRYFEDDPRNGEADYQYCLECWLIERHPDCEWYSVCWIEEE